MRGAKILKLLTSKFLVVCLLLLAELLFVPAVIFLLVVYVNNGWVDFALLLLVIVLDIVLVVFIINSEVNAEYKIAWIVPVLFLPLMGAVCYLLLRKRKIPRRKLRELALRFPGAERLYAQDPAALGKLAAKGDFALQCAELIRKRSFLPATDCCACEYFPSGERYAARMFEVLKQAKKFIFLETFIIARGQFWDSLLAILKERAAAGVDVRVIYDDIGSMTRVPTNYANILEKQGIRCMCFNKFRPVVDVGQNNRTHRKITVIDGETAFTGGLNFADEYLNITHPYGHWKDCGVMVKGRAVQSFTAMFLQMWALRKENEDLSRYVSQSPEGEISCIPFSDTPLGNGTNICEELYLKIIYNAKKYVYITTPYLILDGEMKRALIAAADAGVDVRIIVPNIPDKRFVFSVTKAFYSQLIREIGKIGIYRYTPGFIHAKGIVSDGECCIIGSTNMDFRSWYLHFESNAIFFDKGVSAAVYEDFLETCKKSERVTKEQIKIGPHRTIWRAILRIFAPLM